MKSLRFSLVVITVAVYLLIPDICGVITKRCQSVCSRSDGQDFCQRCRMRVPMRFGKRTDSSRDLGDTKNKIQRIIEDDDESRLDESNQGLLPQQPSENIRAETQILLNSIRNFVKDLDDLNTEFYDQ